MEVFVIIIAVLCILTGFAGIFIPFLPDAPLVFLGAFLAWLLSGGEQLSVWVLAIQFTLMAIVVAADFLAGAYGVKRLGGSKLAQWFSLLGGIIGLFVGNLWGLILGTLIGAVVGELFIEGDIEKSIKVGFASVLGFLGGVLFKVIVLVLMSGLLIVSVFL